MAEPRRYSIEVYGGFWEALQRLPEAQQERVTEFMASHFTVRPRVMIPGQLKQLKGQHAYLYQLDVGKSRLLYEVDDERSVVHIVYLGPHPDWSTRRPNL